MKTLYIDTHLTKFFSIGYFDKNILKIKNGEDSSLELIKKIEEVSKNNIEKIIINTGPGSLTGLRIGSSFAQGIALGKKIKILGINIWTMLFKEYPNIEVYFNTGTKKWIQKTINLENITETPTIPKHSWTSNKQELLNFDITNKIPYPNLIKLMHKYNKFATENIELLYPINSFKTHK